MKPHKISLETFTSYFSWRPWASATTADQTQRKTLLALEGDQRRKVERRYFIDGKIETIYDGSNLEDAIEAYNKLS